MIFMKKYMHDLGDILDRHAPLVSRMTRRDSADWLSDSYTQSPFGASLKELGIGPRIH